MARGIAVQKLLSYTRELLISPRDLLISMREPLIRARDQHIVRLVWLGVWRGIHWRSLSHQVSPKGAVVLPVRGMPNAPCRFDQSMAER